jgi:hypothetical protein
MGNPPCKGRPFSRHRMGLGLRSSSGPEVVGALLGGGSGPDATSYVLALTG